MTSLGIMNGFYPCWKPFTAAMKSRDGGNYGSNSTSESNNNGLHKSDKGVNFMLDVVCLTVTVVVIGGVVLVGLSTDDPILDFQVDSLEVTSMKLYNISNDYYSIVRDQKHITADFYINLTLKNKGRMLMYFNPMRVSLEYDKDDFLSSTMLEPYLLLEDQHRLQFGMGIKDDAHLRNETVELISQDLWGKNVLQFALKAQGNCVRWRRGVFQNCNINVLCDDIKVGFPPETNLTTGSMIVSPHICKCKFDCHYES